MRIIIPILLVFITQACVPHKAIVEKTNYSYLYNPSGNTSLHPQYKVYNDNDSTSLLTGRVITNELMTFFSKDHQTKLSMIKVQYIIKEYDADSIVYAKVYDSATYVLNIKKEKDNTLFYFSFPVKAAKGKKYAMVIRTIDMISLHLSHFFLNIDKTSDTGPQNFTLLNASDKSAMFEPYIVNSRSFMLNHNKPLDSIYILYFKDTLALPAAPASVRKSQYLSAPDSIWKYKYSNSIPFMLPYKGLYLFTVNPKELSGVSVLSLDEDFPKITNLPDMLESLHYIISKKEKRTITASSNKKLALDNFWLERTENNPDRARELLRLYYNRVMYSNFFFTSFREGWKNDRGMIYIIYGIPNTVHKTPDEEIWYYNVNNTKNGKALLFRFKYKDLPYTSNHFELIRNHDRNSYWHNSVNDWREGNILINE